MEPSDFNDHVFEFKAAQVARMLGKDSTRFKNHVGRPVEIATNWWPSAAAVASDLGRVYGTVFIAIKECKPCNGVRLKWSKHGTREAWEASRRQVNGKTYPVRLNGTVFGSVSDAANSIKDGRSFAARYEHVRRHGTRLSLEVRASA